VAFWAPSYLSGFSLEKENVKPELSAAVSLHLLWEPWAAVRVFLLAAKERQTARPSGLRPVTLPQSPESPHPPTSLEARDGDNIPRFGVLACGLNKVSFRCMNLFT
jgi:hypothetical protein